MNRSANSKGEFLLAVTLGLLFLTAIPAVSERTPAGRAPVGTWYLALDTTPFGIPGEFLSGMATFHSDGTFLIVDAGDFGQPGFTGKHLPQFGSWESSPSVRSRGAILHGTSLFLEADLGGEVLNWQRVKFELTLSRDGSVMTGTADVTLLACDDMLPLPSALRCSNPIANASQFLPAAPAPLPVTFTRLNAR